MRGGGKRGAVVMIIISISTLPILSMDTYMCSEGEYSWSHLVPHHFVRPLQFISRISPVPSKIVHQTSLELVAEFLGNVGTKLFQI